MSIPETCDIEQAFGSTAWEWRKCKISPAPAGDSLPKAVRNGGRDRYRFKATTIVVQYRGGPEASWLVKRGERSVRLPGHLCLHDALSQVLGELPTWKN